MKPGATASASALIFTFSGIIFAFLRGLAAGFQANCGFKIPLRDQQQDHVFLWPEEALLPVEVFVTPLGTPRARDVVPTPRW